VPQLRRQALAAQGKLAVAQLVRLQRSRPRIGSRRSVSRQCIGEGPRWGRHSHLP
jgi:hypothetical protein